MWRPAWTSRAVGPSEWPDEFLTETLAAYPRLGLAEEFTGCIRAQAERKPTSSAAVAVASGMVERIANNPLDRR